MADRQCIMCSDFVTADHERMKRHVAIVHGESTFSTLQCGICDQKYYDSDHFQDHIRERPSCASDCLMIIPVPMALRLENAFISLVDQMMKPVHFSVMSSGTSEFALGPNSDNVQPPSQCQTNSQSPSSAMNIIDEVKMECDNGSQEPPNDQMMKAAQFPFISSLLASSATADGMASPSLANLQPQSESDTKNSCLSVKKLSFEKVNAGCNDGKSEAPKIISVTSLADQGHCVDQTTTMHWASSDVHHQEDENPVEKDGLEAFLEREALQSIEKQAHIVEGVTNQKLKMNESEHRSRQKKRRTRPYPIAPDLRLHCQQIIQKHENRLWCSICSRSIIAINFWNALRHAQSHADPHLFTCKLCHHKLNDSGSMRTHLARKHSAFDSDEYIDTTSDRTDELIQLVTRCFDHDFQEEESQMDCLISDHQQELETLPHDIEPHQSAADLSLYHGSHIQSQCVSIMVGGNKLRTSLPNQNRDSNGPKSVIMHTSLFMS